MGDSLSITRRLHRHHKRTRTESDVVRAVLVLQRRAMLDQKCHFGAGIIPMKTINIATGQTSGFVRSIYL